MGNGIAKMIKDMEGGYNAGLMDQDMKDIGKMIGRI